MRRAALPIACRALPGRAGALAAFEASDLGRRLRRLDRPSTNTLPQRHMEDASWGKVERAGAVGRIMAEYDSGEAK